MDDEQRSQDDAHPTDAQAIDAAPIDTSDAVDALDSAQVANVADADGDADITLDDPFADAGPEAAVSESLRNALDQMRDESRRIADLGTGDEQVAAAEGFADAAATLDEQIGSTARAEDERGR